MFFILLLIVAAVCGSIGAVIAGQKSRGCLYNIVVGFIGALVGFWISRALGVHDFLTYRYGSIEFPVLWSIVGSAIFVALIAFFSGGRRSSL